MAPTFAKGAVMSLHTSSIWGRRGRGLLWCKSSFLWLHINIFFLYLSFNSGSTAAKDLEPCHVYIPQLSFLPFLALLCIGYIFSVVTSSIWKIKGVRFSHNFSFIFHCKNCSTSTLSTTGLFSQQYLFVESCRRNLICKASPFDSSTTYPK